MLTATARYWGRFARIRYAEPFEVVRSSLEVDRVPPEEHHVPKWTRPDGPGAPAGTARSVATAPRRRRTRVLVTGAGGPAAIGFLTLAERADVDFYAADTDPVASGLYLVPAERRVMLPRGDAPSSSTSCARSGRLTDPSTTPPSCVEVPTRTAPVLHPFRSRGRTRGPAQSYP